MAEGHMVTCIVRNNEPYMQVVIAASIVFFQTAASGANIAGTALALSGVLLYSFAKRSKPSEPVDVEKVCCFRAKEESLTSRCSCGDNTCISWRVEFRDDVCMCTTLPELCLQAIENSVLENLFTRVSPGTLYAKVTSSGKQAEKPKDSGEDLEYYL